MQKLVTKEDLTLLIKTFDDLPPNRYLPVFPSTKELHKFVEQKGFWLSLKQALENYFKGEILLKGIVVESSSAEAFLMVKINNYINLYNMLSLGWQEIQKAFNGTVLPGNSPGKLFAYILENEACYHFKDNKKRLDAQVLYRGWCQYKKCLNIDDTKIKLETAKLDKLIARLKRQRSKLGNDDEIAEHIFLTSICLEACQKSKDKSVRLKALVYEETKNEHLDMICRQLRSQNFKNNQSQEESSALHYLTVLYTMPLQDS